MYETLVALVLKHEGGYVNDPDDLGGETKYGITKRRYPDLDIKNLTIKQAIEIYKKDFYIPMQVEKIEDINLAFQYFDMGVNAGMSRAKKILVQTEEIAKNSDKPKHEIYRALRVDYYREIAKLRNNQKFLAGWINRTKTNVV